MNQYQVAQFPAYPMPENEADVPLFVQVSRWLTAHSGWRIDGMWNVDIADESGMKWPSVIVQFRKE